MTCCLLIALLLAQPVHPAGKRVDLFKPAKAEKDAPSYRLEPEKDGLVYRGPKFTAHVARDGVVQFNDKISAKRLLPLPLDLPPGTPTLASTLLAHLAGRPRPTPRATQDPSPPPQMFNQTPSIWPSASELTRMDCENPNDSRCPFPRNTKLVMGGGLVDWERFLLVLPKGGASREDKARFLAATESLRTRMAIEAHAEDLKAALWDLPALLERIWSDTRQPPAGRRRLLHELWREYAEMPDTESACATIIAFIRRHLPAGGPDAYTSDELASLHREAGPRFEPYDR